MQAENISRNWIAAFRRTFELCRVAPGQSAAILSETHSRSINVTLARLALEEIGAETFGIVVPSLPAKGVPMRSTGASYALRGMKPVVAALSSSDFIADLTVEGLLHAPELKDILGGGARALYVSNEHPEILERCVADPALKPLIAKGSAMLANGRQMRVTSRAGTELTINLAGARAGGNWGICEEPGTMAHWPGGLVACFPAANSVNGTLVLDQGDINLTFKRYLEAPVTLRIENDHVVAVEGQGFDAEMMRTYYDAFEGTARFATSHVGWGMNEGARWDAFTMYDKGDTNGTEQRAFAGNFLYSTGANLFAGRETECHFDLPVRGCTISVDDQVVVRDGVLDPSLSAAD